jgi:hypothetical protein
MRDNRGMAEIQVTWQLATFLVSAAVLAVLVALVVRELQNDRLPSSTLSTFVGLVLLVMFVAVGSRLSQASEERGPDGRSEFRRVLNQIAIGTALMVGTGLGIWALDSMGVPRAFAKVWIILVGTPGILLLGRSLATTRNRDNWRR